MINTIQINCENRFIIHKDKEFIGVSNENDVEKIKIQLDEERITKDTVLYLEVEFPDATKIPPIKMNRISNTEAEIEVKNSLLKQEGMLKLEIVLINKSNNKTVFKSEIFELEVKEALNVMETTEIDYPTVSQEIEALREQINDLKEKVENLGGFDLSEIQTKIEELESKIEGISSYDDTEIRTEINNLKEEINNIKMTEGPPGENGKSAYEIATENGFEGTVEEWLKSLNGKDGHTPVKGEDYFTEVEVIEIIDSVESKISPKINEIEQEQIVQNNHISNNSNKITVLEEKSGAKINLEVNPTNYIMTLELINSKEEVIDSKEIDFPIESHVVDIRSEGTEIILILQNGNETRVDVSNLVNGLINKETFDNFVTEINKKIDNLFPSAYIKVSKLNTQEIAASTKTNVIFDRVVKNTNTDFFKLEDNKIYCNFDGIVIIDSLIQWGYVNGNAYTYIMKNGEMIGTFYNDLAITKNSTIIDVKKGDSISLDCYNDSASSITNLANWDYLIVSKIGGVDIFSQENINDASLKLSNDSKIIFIPEKGQAVDGWGGCYYYKIGTKVCVHIAVDLGTNIRNRVFILPEGFRPPGTIPIWGGGADGTVPDNSFAEIFPTGEIWVTAPTEFALIVVSYDVFEDDPQQAFINRYKSDI